MQFCGHFAYMKADSFVGKERAKFCPYCCCKAAGTRSKWACTTMHALMMNLKAGALLGQVVAVESKVLRGSKGASDFVVLPVRIAIEVDGEHHFKGEIHGDGEQWRRDMEKNIEYWRQGWGVVRLHHNRAGLVAPLLQQALEERRMFPNKAFIIFSKGYGLSDLFERKGHTLHTPPAM
jgi:very-short-patch-repair endonuclease